MTIVTHPHARRGLRSGEVGAVERRQWFWLGSGLVLVFLIPYLFTDVTSVDRDLYYAIYVGTVFAFTGLWLRFATGSPRAVLLRNWRAGAALGVLFVARWS